MLSTGASLDAASPLAPGGAAVIVSVEMEEDMYNPLCLAERKIRLYRDLKYIVEAVNNRSVVIPAPYALCPGKVKIQNMP
jgi:hypothetical protein